MADEQNGSGPGAQSYVIHTFEHRAYPLPVERAFRIGRDAACDIMVNEVFVSRHHAEVRPEGDEFILHPTGSSPTRVNELPLAAPHPLQEGDSFMVGTMRFIFTRSRLPVAMSVATPTTHMSGVDDRRPTLAYPLAAQAAEAERQKGTSPWLWVGGLALFLVILYAVFAARTV